MTTLLIALLAKSSLIAALGLGLSSTVARRAVDRADVLRATVLVLLALPALMALVPALRLDLLPPPTALAATTPLWSGTLSPVEGVTVSGTVLMPSLAEALAWAWSLGAAVVAARFALGVWTLSRWTASGRPVPAGPWTDALGRVAARRPALRVSDRIAGPLSWGLPPGAVLLDPATLARPETAPAVIAHELAHLHRRDWLFLVLSRLALALFWFNPLVWVLHRALIDRSEDAADAIAVGRVDRHAYARALVGLAAGSSRPLAAAAMAARGPALKRRIAAIMSETPAPPRRPAVILGAVAALVAVATPIAALEIGRREIQIPFTGLAPMPPQPPRAPTPPNPPEPPSPVPTLPSDFAPPAPPAPPEPPTFLADGDDVWVYSNDDDWGDQDREAAREEARADRENLRAQARAARADALARGEAARADSRSRAAAAASDARIAGEYARAAGEQARAQARVAVRQAERAMANARVDMRRGAEGMRRGAEQMRQEGRRLADPAYRAEQIEENRARGQIVTDAELRALGPRLIEQADDLERQADQLAAQAADIG